jgi:hypothetical protein
MASRSTIESIRRSVLVLLKQTTIEANIFCMVLGWWYVPEPFTV